MIQNAITVDVEEYFHVSAFERFIHPNDWENLPSRVEDNVKTILDMFDIYGIKGTFFVLGWVAERNPGLVTEIGKRGHEIACHGFKHEIVYRIGPKNFRADIYRAKKSIENVLGSRVIGYRAPSYSITRKSLWALDILVEEGFLYDSSIYPIYRGQYGIPNWDRFTSRIETGAGTIIEIPISTIRIGNINFPIGGGGYLRLLPIKFIKYSIRYINETECKPAIIYFHPWEIDPNQPRIKSNILSRLRHYTNIEAMEHKINDILSTFKFSTIKGNIVSF